MAIAGFGAWPRLPALLGPATARLRMPSRPRFGTGYEISRTAVWRLHADRPFLDRLDSSTSGSERRSKVDPLSHWTVRFAGKSIHLPPIGSCTAQREGAAFTPGPENPILCELLDDFRRRLGDRPWCGPVQYRDTVCIGAGKIPPNRMDRRQSPHLWGIAGIEDSNGDSSQSTPSTWRQLAATGRASRLAPAYAIDVIRCAIATSRFPHQGNRLPGTIP